MDPRDLVVLRGRATDAEDGDLPSSSLRWVVLLHHNTHTHPFITSRKSVTGGTFSNIFGIIENYASDRDADLYSTGWNTAYDGDNGWKGFLDLAWSRTDREDDFLQTTAGTGRGRSGALQIGPTTPMTAAISRLPGLSDWVSSSHNPNIASDR